MRLRNSTPLLITKGQEAHLAAVGPGTACSALVTGRLVTYIQARVYVKPSWCTSCFPGGMPQ